MRELSLHILDIAKNSVKANASLIEIIVDEDMLLKGLKVIYNKNR